MVHFQSKNHLLMWLENNCPRRAVVRALLEGTVEYLGGFSKIPPTTQPGWITKVTSIHGKEWIVAVIAYQNRYGIRILSEVPWRWWNGNAGRCADLMNGDNPEACEHHKLIAEFNFIDGMTE
ncbi:hypothetical protein LCGC14_0720030 [marine sediment metagenome]|uniref:Uncharacterized protein n=1 Tax=marine sediment metagenome TaxID=412755 RepID=A0A0F9QXR3_9ZZZZ